jgi:hypothetical protein
MNNRFNQFWMKGVESISSQNDPELERSCTGRIVRALTFITIIIFLGLWITVFLVVKERFGTEAQPGNSLTNLTCLTFFGGLVIVLFAGGLAGNLLRRASWKWLIRRKRS